MPKNNKIEEENETSEELQAFLDEASGADSFDDDEQMEKLPEPIVTPEAGNDQPAAQKASEDQDELDSDGLKAGEGEITQPQAAEPAAPVETPPASSEAQVPGQESQPVAPEAQAVVPAAQPAPSATPAQPSTPDQMVGIYNDWRNESESLLASHHYNLSHEQVEELELEPHKAIPKLMAKVYLDAVSAAIGQITTHLPRMVRLVSEQEQANTATENTFWDKWPDLKNEKDTVVRIGQAYRAQNPHASADDFINNVGAMAMVALKKPIVGQPQSTPAPVQTPGFVPAAQTPVGGVPQRAPVGNMFTRADAEMFEEDLDP